jgi:hypothetical protein
MIIGEMMSIWPLLNQIGQYIEILKESFLG